MKTLLKDQTDTKRTLPVEVAVEGNGMGIVIRPEGYGCFGCVDGTVGPIYLEFYEGRMRLLVWDDINQEDPSHVIDLEEAREDRRSET